MVDRLKRVAIYLLRYYYDKMRAKRVTVLLSFVFPNCCITLL